MIKCKDHNNIYKRCLFHSDKYLDHTDQKNNANTTSAEIEITYFLTLFEDASMARKTSRAAFVMGVPGPNTPATPCLYKSS